MVFSSACEYAIRSMVYLAGRDDSRPVQVRDIAQALGIPQPFLAKVVQILSRQGLLTTTKGPGGGVALIRDPKETTLLHVVEATDGLNVTRACVLGIPQCTEEKPCPLHGQWSAIRKAIMEMLAGESIAKSAQGLKTSGTVLTR